MPYSSIQCKTIENLVQSNLLCSLVYSVLCSVQWSVQCSAVQDIGECSNAVETLGWEVPSDFSYAVEFWH